MPLCFPNACSGQEWARSKLESENTSQVSQTPLGLPPRVRVSREIELGTKLGLSHGHSEVRFGCDNGSTHLLLSNS